MLGHWYTLLLRRVAAVISGAREAGAWKVTTGAGVSVLAAGDFT